MIIPNNKFIFLILLLPVLQVFGQDISNYQKVYVASDFKDFSPDKYQLSTQIKKALEAKNYIVITEKPDLILSDCDFAVANLEKTSSLLRNRVTLTFNDCNGKNIFQTQEMSMYKDYEKGFPDALKKALIKVPTSNPSSIAKVITEKKDNNTPVNDTTLTDAIDNQNQKLPNTATHFYELNSETYQKIELGNGNFILVSPKSSAPIATFNSTSKSDTYRVILQNGDVAIGFADQDNLIVEITTKSATTQQLIFKKKN